MKRVRCPKCDSFITFDETKYEAGQSLIFTCPNCSKQFGVRIGTPKVLDKEQRTMHPDNVSATAEDSDGAATAERQPVGELVVIENVFHYKQVIPLYMGVNTIGRYQKGNPINCPIETVDPSMDMTHCRISVGRDKKGRLRFTLSDGPSNTGTFVDNAILGDKERRIIYNDTLFTIGATSIILKVADEASFPLHKTT